MDKGKLIYETPLPKKSHTLVGLLIYVLYLILIVIIIIGSNGLAEIKSIVERIIYAIGLFIGLFIAFSIPAFQFFHTKFRIYEHGVTEEVWNLTSPFKEEGKLIKYTDMIAFEEAPEGRGCYIYLKPNVFYHHNERSEEVLDILIENLKEHNIKEIPNQCLNCNEIMTPRRKCLNCGKKRY